MVHAEQNVANQEWRVVDDSNKFTKETLLKDWAKEFLRWVDPIKAEN